MHPGSTNMSSLVKTGICILILASGLLSSTAFGQNTAKVSQSSISGKWKFVIDELECSIEITRMKDGKYFVQGEAFWGLNRTGGPHMGEVSFIAKLKNNTLTWTAKEGDYTITLTYKDGSLIVTEKGRNYDYGANVAFAGTYKRKP